MMFHFHFGRFDRILFFYQIGTPETGQTWDHGQG